MTSPRLVAGDLALMVGSAAAGDEAAFASIVDAYQADMERVSFAICGDIELAREGVQVAWTIVWRRLGTLRDAARLRPWLATVAANETRRLGRRSRGRRLIEIPVSPTDADAPRGGPDPAARVAEVDLANAMRRLPEVDRTIVALRFLADMTSAEIGPAVGLSAAGVRTRLARALDRLREDLDHD
jgi:RNA polymerase sigma-70 factor (ECF subfamily)